MVPPRKLSRHSGLLGVGIVLVVAFEGGVRGPACVQREVGWQQRDIFAPEAPKKYNVACQREKWKSKI